MTLTFTVAGIAKPQGSAKAFMPKGWTRPIITSDNKNLKAWRDLVASAASDAIVAAGGTEVIVAPRAPASTHLDGRAPARARGARPRSRSEPPRAARNGGCLRRRRTSSATCSTSLAARAASGV